MVNKFFQAERFGNLLMLRQHIATPADINVIYFFVENVPESQIAVGASAETDRLTVSGDRADI